MNPVQDRLGLKVSGIPCACGQCYIGQTGCNIELCCTEYKRHLRLGHKDQSTLAEYERGTGHEIRFSEEVKLFQSIHWGGKVICEALEICLEAKAVNKEDGMKYGATWFSAMDLIVYKSIA